MARVKAGTPLTITWNPDPIVFGESILEVDAALSRTGIPLSVIAGEVRADIKERFATRTAPSGAPWKDYSDSYEPKAVAYPNIGMLRRDDYLYQAVTGPDAIIVTNETLFFNEDAMASIPPSSGRKTGSNRGFIHQEGSDKIPARPFLGLTNETRVFIDASFTEWFNRAIMLFPKKSGGIGIKHQLRSPGSKGRFVPRSTPMPSFVRIR